MPDKTQSDMVLGWQGMRRLDPDFDAARLANTVLGVFGMMGRLGENVREGQGMAYYAYSRLSGDREPGTWVAVAGVNPANVRSAQQAMLDEVKRLQDELVPEEELEDSKRYLTGSVPLQLETNDGVASLLADIEWHQLGAGLPGALSDDHQQPDGRAGPEGRAEVFQPVCLCAGHCRPEWS